MSKNTTDPIVVTEDGTIVEETPKESFLRRKVVNPIKKHPKIATAIVAGVALVGAAALLGQDSPESPHEILPSTDGEADVPDTAPDES